MPVSEADEPKALGCAIFVPHDNDTCKGSERVKKVTEVVLTERLAILGSGEVLDVEVRRASGLLGTITVDLGDKLLNLQPTLQIFALTADLRKQLLIESVDGFLNRLICVHGDEAVPT